MLISAPKQASSISWGQTLSEMDLSRHTPRKTPIKTKPILLQVSVAPLNSSLNYLCPVVQSIVKLISLLRGQRVQCFTTLLPNTLIFFVEKMRKAFQIFSIKSVGIFQMLMFEILMNC